jgi:hypothetical protein
MAAEECVRAWEGAYRYYGRMWELTARAPKGDPAAAREMAAAWRAIEAVTPLPWWTLAALQSAAAAFDEQAQKYDEDSEGYAKLSLKK